MMTGSAPQPEMFEDMYMPTDEIPPMEHPEAYQLGMTELERFLELLENLKPEEWNNPTYCTGWSVRDIAAHQAASYTAYARLKEFGRLYLFNPLAEKFPPPVDVINQLQIQDRADRSPAELIEELRKSGPIALRNRQRIPGFIRSIPMYMPPPIDARMRFDYLTDHIYPRDAWIHRLDICHAVGAEFLQTVGHDDRQNALMVRELGFDLGAKFPGHTIQLWLDGIAGGQYRIGPDRHPNVLIRMDVLDFHLLASGRKSVQTILDEDLVGIQGDPDLVEEILQEIKIVY